MRANSKRIYSYISVVVPTVERGLREITFCSIAIAGGMLLMKSHSGLLIRPRNCLAYDERLSTYLRWLSTHYMPKVSEDFPEPETPVMVINLLRGILSDTFFKLFTRAPFISIYSSIITLLFLS